MKTSIFINGLLVGLGLATSGCAVLYHAQVSEVDSQTVLQGRRFEVMVSETGVNLNQAADVSKAVFSNKTQQKDADRIRDTIAMFQMGPRTGNPVYNEKYTDILVERVLAECPSGQISGLTSIREAANYPVISGEIVKIIGYCKGSKS